MTAPEIQPELPEIPEALAQSKNAVHKLSYQMIKAGLGMLREFMVTKFKYETTQDNAETALEDDDTEVEQVKIYQAKKAEFEDADKQDEREYLEQIKPFKEAYEQKVNARKNQLDSEYKTAALAALNLDASITEADYLGATEGAIEIVETINAAVNTVKDQGFREAFADWKLPNFKDVSKAGSGTIGFTPKFALVKINGELQPVDKLQNNALIKKLGTDKATWFKHFLVDLRGATSADKEKVWRDADPGFVHTFTVPVSGGKTYEVEVMKAARKREETPGLNVSTPQEDNTVAPITDQESAPEETSPVQF